MRKLLIFVPFLLLASLVFYGCTSKGTDSSSSVSVNSVSDNSAATSEQKVSRTPDPVTLETFTIYDIDSSTMKPVPSYNFPVNKNADFHAKVDAIASEVVKNYFPGLLYGMSYKKVDGKTLGVFNMIDTKPHTFEYTWYQKMQGSTGAQLSYKRIVENLLQRNYKGTWIDGVEILYNGSSAEFEHAPEISSVIYR
ncbi:MAG: hypothetical protein ABRQ25_18885 [Clostridiaceae bacterium]